jgi:hypothetical protein
VIRRAVSAWLVLALMFGLAVLLATRASREAFKPEEPTAKNATYIDIEHFNDTPVGAVPPDWTVDTSGGTVAVSSQPDTTDHSLELTKTGSTGVVAAARALPRLTGTVRVEARVRGMRVDGMLDVLTIAGETAPIVRIAIHQGRFFDVGSNQLFGTAINGRWYAVRVEIQLAQQRFDVDIDGETVLADEPLRAPAKVLTGLTVGIGVGHQGKINIDNVAAAQVPDPSVPYLVADQFNDVQVDYLPDSFKTVIEAGTAAVTATPSAQNRSLRLAKTTAAATVTAERPFTPQTGAMTVRADLRTDEPGGTKAALYLLSSHDNIAVSLQFVDGWLVYSDGEASHRLTEITAGEWYTVQLTVDVAARQFELFVDGRRFSPPETDPALTPAWTFRDVRSTDVNRVRFAIGAGQVGSIRIDNLLVYPNPAPSSANVLDVRKPPYNAVGDGKTDDTEAIRRAVNDVRAGGVVLLAGGTFLSGTIRLKSDMILRVARGATLRGMPDESSYPEYDQVTSGAPSVGITTWRALLYTLGASNVHIDGGGTIDGNGNQPKWLIEDKGADPDNPIRRPFLIALMKGKNISVRNVYLKDAAAWALVPVEVDGMLIADVNINSNIYANRDGIDVVDSKNVLVERISAWTDDDSICLKSYSSTGVSAVTVRLSTVGRSERANGIKLGTASVGHFHDITVEDVLVKHTNNSAITLTAVDGGTVANVSFRRITVDDTLRAFFMLLGKREKTAALPAWVSGIRIEDVIGSWLAEPSVISGQLLGSSTYRMYDILISGTQLAVPGGITRVPGQPAEYAGKYPESNLWTKTTTLPVAGLLIRHADSVTVRASTVTLQRRDARPLMGTEDVSSAIIGST